MRDITNTYEITNLNSTTTYNKNSIPVVDGDNMFKVRVNSDGVIIEYPLNIYVQTTITNFEYNSEKSNGQIYQVANTGRYKIELWGAQGGGDDGGLGAYTSGIINLNPNQTLYAYVGSAGQYTGIGNSVLLGGYNGGGNSSNAVDDTFDGLSTSGGGATDVRITSGNWDDFDSLKSRIMVAAGGSGYAMFSTGNKGAPGGGVEGLEGIHNTNTPVGERVNSRGTGGTQTSPGGNVRGETTYDGDFGKGGNGDTEHSYWGGGGGSGYYGGGAGKDHGAPGGSGSSFVSGHVGCNAIDINATKSNLLHRDNPNHYLGFIFNEPTIIDGSGCIWSTEAGECNGMPKHNGSGTMTGNSGNGYARITYLGE